MRGEIGSCDQSHTQNDSLGLMRNCSLLENELAEIGFDTLNLRQS